MSKLKWWWGWIKWQPKRIGWAYIRWMVWWERDSSTNNIRMYGARGDGKSDDSYALRDASRPR